MWGEVTWGRWRCASATPGYDKNPLQGLCAVDGVRPGECCGRCGRFNQPAAAGVRGHPQPAKEGRLKIGPLIEAARAGNSTLVTMYGQIGQRIREDMLNEQRAGYGDETVSTLSKQLTAEYGRGFTRANLFHRIRFAEVFPDEEIVSALRRQLSWTHFKELIYLDDSLNASCTPRCAESNAGALARCGTRSSTWCRSGPPSASSPRC